MKTSKTILKWKQIPLDNKMDIWIERKELLNYRQYLIGSAFLERELWFGKGCSKSNIKITFDEILNEVCSWHGNKVERTISIIDDGMVIRKYQRIK